MKALSARDPKYDFDRLINLARAEPVAVVEVMAVEEYQQLKVLETDHVDHGPRTTAKQE